MTRWVQWGSGTCFSGLRVATDLPVIGSVFWKEGGDENRYTDGTDTETRCILAGDLVCAYAFRYGSIGAQHNLQSYSSRCACGCSLSLRRAGVPRGGQWRMTMDSNNGRRVTPGPATGLGVDLRMLPAFGWFGARPLYHSLHFYDALATSRRTPNMGFPYSFAYPTHWAAH